MLARERSVAADRVTNRRGWRPVDGDCGIDTKRGVRCHSNSSDVDSGKFLFLSLSHFLFARHSGCHTRTHAYTHPHTRTHAHTPCTQIPTAADFGADISLFPEGETDAHGDPLDLRLDTSWTYHVGEVVAVVAVDVTVVAVVAVDVTVVQRRSCVVS